MLFLFVSVVFSTTILLTMCLSREPPPLYTVRMERNRKRFANDENVKKYTARLKKERQQEDAEAIKLDLLRPVAENKKKTQQTVKESENSKIQPDSDSSDVSRRQKDDEKEDLSNSKIFPAKEVATQLEENKTVRSLSPSTARTALQMPAATGSKRLAPSVMKTTNVQSARKAIIWKKPSEGEKGLATAALLPTLLVEVKKTPEPNLKAAVVADKTVLDFVVAGGQQKIKLTNKGSVPLVIKTRCSDNKIYGCLPVFSHVEPGKSVNVTVTRLGAPAKPDKVVFEWLPESEGEKDFAAHFRKYKIVENKIDMPAVTK